MDNLFYDPELIKGNPDKLSGIVLIVTPLGNRHHQTLASHSEEKLFYVARHLIEQGVEGASKLEDKIGQLQRDSIEIPNKYANSMKAMCVEPRESLEQYLPDDVIVDIYETEDLSKPRAVVHKFQEDVA